jgi:hypothetical protein
VSIPLAKGYMLVLAHSLHQEVSPKVTALVLHLNPKTVVDNQYDDLVITQDGVIDHLLAIKKGERTPLYWFSRHSRFI